MTMLLIKVIRLTDDFYMCAVGAIARNTHML